MWGRYVILRVLLECDNLVTITQVTGADGQPDLIITIDKTRIESAGQAAIGDFLRKLQVWESGLTVFVLWEAWYHDHTSVV